VHSVSRRNILRLAGGVAATGGVLGAGTLAPAHAAQRKVKARLNTSVVQSGDRLTLHISENLSQARKIRVKDSEGLVWKRRIRKPRYQVWTARTKKTGRGTVTVVTRRADGKVFRNKLDYHVTAAGSGSTAVAAGAALIGMSSPADVWDTRVAEVGGGLAARRIFADLADGPTSQLKLVEEAHAAGMLPVISYKVGGDAAGAAAGKFNAVAEQAAAKLASYGKPTAVTFWHEPYGNLSGEQYAAASRQLLPIFKRGELRVGPILNGWLLDNKVADFASFCPDDLFDVWDWFGIDTYESGTMDSPGARKPAERIPALVSYLQSRGQDLPIGIGEYNGYSAETIAAAGAAILGTPNVWFGCMWNATEGKGHTLEGERLEAFRRTLADARTAQAG
jgi:hypothetical protein